MVLSEERLLYSLLGNLLRNAIEASPQGQTITCGVRGNGEAAISIRNSGVVPKLIREHFFEKYKTHGKSSGTGLGTYSAKLLARAMHHDIRMETSDALNSTWSPWSSPPKTGTEAATMANPKRILVVDDEPHNILLLKTLLRQMGHETAEAANAIAALRMLDQTVDLVLSDVKMPGMNGFEMVRQMRSNPALDDIPVIMVTTLGDKASRLAAVEAGATDFVNKPVDQAELRIRLGACLRLKEKSDEVRHFQRDLMGMVEDRTLALRQALAQLRDSNLEIVHRLSAAAESRDPETGAHIMRMSNYCVLLARRLGLPDEEVDIVRHASPMHDVGKIAVPDAILLKPGRLDPAEWEEMRAHTLHGARILANPSTPLLKAAEVIARTHHERFDGTGYPTGLAGEDIPLLGRICAVADVFDALTSLRPYKPALGEEESLAIMRQGRRSHFDPAILDVFMTSLDEVRTIRDEYRD